METSDQLCMYLESLLDRGINTLVFVFVLVFAFVFVFEFVFILVEIFCLLISVLSGFASEQRRRSVTATLGETDRVS